MAAKPLTSDEFVAFKGHLTALIVDDDDLARLYATIEALSAQHHPRRHPPMTVIAVLAVASLVAGAIGICAHKRLLDATVVAYDGDCPICANIRRTTRDSR